MPGARPATLPEFIPPMLATLTEKPFSREGWIFEPKLDGYRTMALIRRDAVRLLSRRGNDNTREFPRIASELREMAQHETVYDGEVVALDEQGRPSFQLLQGHMMPWLKARARGAEQPAAIIYFVFDILYLDGYDLTKATLRDRKQVLASSLTPSTGVRLIEYFPDQGEAVYQAALGQGFEGVIAKRFDSVYQPGRRSRDWLKIKAVLTDEFVIGGYSQGLGSRAQAFGALLVGQYDESARLIYSGHVGTGFDENSLVRLKQTLDNIRTEECPFAGTPPLTTPATWVRPELVAEIKFSEWTRDGRLRTPVYIGLRQDKVASEIRRARVVAPPGAAPTPEEAAGGPVGPPAAAQITIPPVTARQAAVSTRVPPVESLLRELQRKGEAFTVCVDGHEIALNNLDKELWPAFEGRRGLTKRNLLVYLAGVAPYLLPHLKDRPLTLKRYPDGIHGEYFYQKHWPFPLPEFVVTTFAHERNGEEKKPYIMCNNLPTLMWLGQLADIELHTWFSRISPSPDLPGKKTSPELLDYPDFIIFDLDPYIYSGAEAEGAEPQLSRAAFGRTCEVALWLKEVLDSLSISSFVRTSGRTGLHIYLPIIRNLSYHQVQAAAGTIGKFLWQKHPRDITLDWTVKRRTGLVFFDYNQNVYGKTLASIYSPRASPEATVAMPLPWEELAGAFPTDFTILTVPDRLSRTGDLWATILDAKRDLRALLGQKSKINVTKRQPLRSNSQKRSHESKLTHGLQSYRRRFQP